MKTIISKALNKFTIVMAAAGMAEGGDTETAKELLAEIESMKQKQSSKRRKLGTVVPPLTHGAGAN